MNALLNWFFAAYESGKVIRQLGSGRNKKEDYNMYQFWPSQIAFHFSRGIWAGNYHLLIRPVTNEHASDGRNGW